MISSLTVANFFIKKSIQENKGINVQKLLKLVFSSQAWHLGYFEKPLFEDNIVSAKFGVTIPNLYRHVHQWKNTVISAQIPNVVDISLLSLPHEHSMALLAHIWKSYADILPVELSNLIDTETVLPYKYRNENSTKFNGSIIPLCEIKDEYQKLVIVNQVKQGQTY